MKYFFLICFFSLFSIHTFANEHDHDDHQERQKKENKVIKEIILNHQLAQHLSLYQMNLKILYYLF